MNLPYLSKRKMKKLIRELSNESSVSQSVNNNRDGIKELSVEQLREQLNSRAIHGAQQSHRTLQNLFKFYSQGNTDSLLKFTGCFTNWVADNPNIINEFMAEYKTQRQEFLNSWYKICTLKLNDKFDTHAVNLVNIIYQILIDGNLGLNAQLFLIFYLLISSFWKDFASLSIDKSNTIVQQLKAIIKCFTRIVKRKEQIIDSLKQQLIEQICNELQSFLLTLFQTVKKKSNYFYCFIVLSEIIDKLTKKNLISSLDQKMLNQLEINLNKKQKVIFDEIFMKQPDPLFDKHLVLKSAALQAYREELFNIYITYEYRNTISFTHLLYTLDNLHEICTNVEKDHPRAFEKLLEFKVLVKTMSEIFEYFCTKLSNMNTEALKLLDTHLEGVQYFVKFLSNKKKQELLNAYLKVNEYFDKTPSSGIEKLFSGKDEIKKEQIEAKNRKREKLDFSERVLANLKLNKKEPDLRERCQKTANLLKFIKEEGDGTIQNKAKSKVFKSVFRLTKEAADAPLSKVEVKLALEECIISYLDIPFLTNKGYLEKLKDKYEVFIKAHNVQGKPEIFKQIKLNLENMFTLEQKKSNGSSPNLVGLSRETSSNIPELSLSREVSELLNQALEEYLFNNFKPLMKGWVLLTQDQFLNYYGKLRRLLTESSPQLIENAKKLPNIDEILDKLNKVSKNILCSWSNHDQFVIERIKLFREEYNKFLENFGKQSEPIEYYLGEDGEILFNNIIAGEKFIDSTKQTYEFTIDDPSKLILMGFEEIKPNQQIFEPFKSSYPDIIEQLNKVQNVNNTFRMFILTREKNLPAKTTIAVTYFIVESNTGYHCVIVPSFYKIISV